MYFICQLIYKKMFMTCILFLELGTWIHILLWQKKYNKASCQSFFFFNFFLCNPYLGNIILSRVIVWQSLTVNNFYIGSGSDFSGVPTKLLTVNGSLRLSVYNPATIFGIHVSSTPVNLIYSEITVATGQVTYYITTFDDDVLHCP